MKVKVALLFLCLMIFTTGCTTAKQQAPAQTPTENKTTKPDEAKPEVVKAVYSPRVGDLSLGMSLEELNKVLSGKFSEEKMSAENYFGQEYYQRHYEEGLDIAVAKTDGILQLTVKDPRLATDLGVKVGDNAEVALAKYRTKYSEWVGNQSPDKLIGWFEVKPGVLVILDYKKDKTGFNPSVKKDDKITAITLGYTKYFD